MFKSTIFKYNRISLTPIRLKTTYKYNYNYINLKQFKQGNYQIINKQSILNKLRFKLIKSTRPYNTDDISFFFSFFITTNILLLLITTTTFFSILLISMNTVFAQEFVASKIGELITKNSGLLVVFEKGGVVGGWKDGKIEFTNCYVSKRPKNKKLFKKRSDDDNDEEEQKQKKQVEEEVDDGNYTQFDFNIDSISLTLSFSKFLSGKGIVDECYLKGIRGIVDRSHVYWKPGDLATNYKNVHKFGDWEINKLKIQDMLFTMINPNGFRPFEVSIYDANLINFTKNWLFLNFLTSNIHSNGCYDGSLFTINKLSKIDEFIDENLIDLQIDELKGINKIEKIDLNELSLNDKINVTRFRIDNLKIEHLNGGMDGPIGWINKGTADMIGDVIVTNKNKNGLNDIIEYFLKEKINNQPNTTLTNDKIDDLFVMDFYIRLNNPKASVPLFSSDLSYINSALIRPIVGYINSNKTFIPLKCRIIKNIEDFNGSWTMYDSLLMDDLQQGVYTNLVEYLSNDQLQKDRFKKVGFWSLQFLIQLVLWSLSGV
ncbi:hypothetical protein CANARDRAFT_177572 [[Candida] arabinofermentans NRRL YB-2248]|uniref:Mitochondrial distribution and morphology protein 31 n=1 Tax=[Candida] arabinofermentans NRRL YB-2248 TaxID=983967 RepID=A0A1E4SVX5_9ASCO|nr:hypothetical protein CANARDRAFT_177572 [[Candida] arabinofermentans NRRL YB-2248]